MGADLRRPHSLVDGTRAEPSRRPGRSPAPSARNRTSQERGGATDASNALAALRAATVAFAEAVAGSDAVLRPALDHLIAVTGADAGAVAVPGADGRPRVLAERSTDDLGPLSMTALQSALAAEHPEALIT